MSLAHSTAAQDGNPEFLGGGGALGPVGPVGSVSGRRQSHFALWSLISYYPVLVCVLLRSQSRFPGGEGMVFVCMHDNPI